MFFGSPAQDRSDAQPEKCPLARARAWPPMATSAGPSDALLEPTPASQLPRDRGGRPTPLTAGAHSPTPAHAQSESSPSSPPAGTPRSGCGSDAPGGGQARVLTPLSSSDGNFRDGAPASPSGDGHAAMAELASGVQLLQAGVARCRSGKRFRKVSPRAARPSGLQPRSAWRTTSSSAS